MSWPSSPRKLVLARQGHFSRVSATYISLTPKKVRHLADLLDYLPLKTPVADDANPIVASQESP